MRVRVQAPGKGWSGTGTVIYVLASGTHYPTHYGVILTNRHVVDGGQTYQVDFPSGPQNVAAHYISQDSTADLGMLYVYATSATPSVAIAAAPVNIGATVQIAGYPGGQGPVPRVGQWLGARGLTDTGAQVYESSIPCKGGDSGSGFCNTSDQLVGVLWGGPVGGGAPSVGVGHADVVRFVTACWPKLPWRRPPQQPQQPPPPVAPPVAPPDNPPPALPPVPPTSPDPILSGKILELEAKMRDLIARLQSLEVGVPERLQDLEAKLKAFQGLGGKLEDLAGKVAATDGLPTKIKELAEKIATGDKNLEVVTKVIEEVLKVAQAGSVGPLLTAGAATGGIGVPVMLAGWALLSLFGKRTTAQPGNPVGGGPTPPAPMPMPFPVQPPPPTPIVLTSPPPQQSIHTQSTYVPYEAPNAELTALKRAMDELVIKHPGSIDTVETIKAWGQQLLAGQKKPTA